MLNDKTIENQASGNGGSHPMNKMCIRDRLNYMDANIQAGLKGLALARRLGVPVVVMEPVKGGSLTMLPEDIRRRLAAVCPERTPAAWALDWVAEQPGVSVILSGMSSICLLYTSRCV